jgi:DNA (cytosine-5)-methyltransferase 1/putative restriction endonuclease
MQPAREADTPVTVQVRRPWRRDELVAAFRLYCLLPFGQLDHRTPEIMALAQVLGRTPSAVAMKLVNLASLDPAITATGRKGLSNASAGDRGIWKEFHDDWAALEEESGEILQQLGYPEAEVIAPTAPIPPVGETSVEALVRVRRGQDFFRRMVLASYEGKCCISGLAEPSLLLASHIVPWVQDADNRLNPCNGLCLSALHDRAFDLGLIAVNTDFRLRVSPLLRDQAGNALAQGWLLNLEGTRIRLPRRFRPAPEFLAWHLESVFQAG